MAVQYDIAVVGSSFGGSLVAMIARRLGYSVVMIERDRHPRFAIGESSTPLSNLLLESLAARFDLPRIAALAKWGTWQQTHREVAAGLKRGFTFFHHDWNSQPSAGTEPRHELLVAASPTDAIADTHWYRPDVDHLFHREAISLGVVSHEGVQLTGWETAADFLTLQGTQDGRPVSFCARFLVDASGPRGFLHRHAGGSDLPIPSVAPAEALYTHFAGLRRWDSLHPTAPGCPFAPDDAALHHVFPGGWMWILRFNNGITSAGVSVSPQTASRLGLSEGEPAWHRLLQSLPAIQAQFEGARPLRPFVHSPRLSFRSSVLNADRWVRLPSATGFVDPLLSTGFALNLLGVERIAALLAEGLRPGGEALRLHEQASEADLLAAGRLIGALQRQFGNPEAFSTLLMLYFAAASFSETARRLGRPHLAPGFLMHGHPSFGPESRALLEWGAQEPQVVTTPAFVERVRRAASTIDVGGWFDSGRTRWHPVETAPLFRAASRLESSIPELESLLRRAGFPEAMQQQNPLPSER